MDARVKSGFLVLLPRRSLAGLLFFGTLAAAAKAEDPADLAAPLDLAIRAAEASLAASDFRAAEGHYHRALFEGWLLKGTADGLDKSVPEARAALEKARENLPEEGPARRDLATVFLQIGEAEAAATLLTPLAASDPRDVESHRLLAKAQAAAGQYDQAVATLDEATAAHTDDPEAAYLLGTEYLWLNLPGAAERLFAMVLRARPIPQTHVLIARAYRDGREYGRARAELKAALLQDPRVRRAHYYLGMIALADATTAPDRLALAIAEFQEELKLEPDDPPTNDQLGTALLELERAAEALPFLETAVRGDPRAVYVYHLGRGQLALGRTPEGVATLRRALELAAERGAAEADLQKMHYQLGLGLRKLGRPEEAMTHLAEARRLGDAATQVSNPDSTDPSRRPRGTRLTIQGSLLAELPPAARTDLRRGAVEGLARAYFNLGVLQAQSPTPVRSSERFAKAAALFTSAAELDPGFPNVQSSLGIALFNARQFEQAIAPLERARAASPDDPGLRHMLAISLLNTEAWDKAADLLRPDAERETNASLQSAYGLALVRGGRGAEAEKVLSGLLAQQGESAELRGLLGQAYAQQGKDGLAVEQLEAAARLAPDDAAVREELGRAYQRLGRTVPAEREFEAARRLKAKPPEGTP